jgi:nucleotidyltransferase substrate binding protein (TIGR01987 family)
MQNKLDLTEFKKSIKTLEIAIMEYQNNGNEFVADSCIKRFEYFYDFATKIIKRHLKIQTPNPVEINEITFPDHIRTAYSQSILLHSWDKWHEYRDDRYATSHGYIQDRALEITDKLPIF